jgi:toxin ParE1/3/4
LCINVTTKLLFRQCLFLSWLRRGGPVRDTSAPPSLQPEPRLYLLLSIFFRLGFQDHYERLLSTAVVALLTSPDRIGSAARPELGDGVRSNHLRHSRADSGVARPRHLILYRIGDAGTVEVGRVLHDAMEPERHVQFDFPPEP